MIWGNKLFQSAAVQNTERAGHCMKECCFFFNKADGSKEWLLYDLRPFLWVWITGHRVTSGGNKRSTAAEVIRETRCQMLMLGNIDSTNVSAKEKHYGGKKKEKKKSWPGRKAPVPTLHTYNYCTHYLKHNPLTCICECRRLQIHQCTQTSQGHTG